MKEKRKRKEGEGGKSRKIETERKYRLYLETEKKNPSLFRNGK